MQKQAGGFHGVKNWLVVFAFGMLLCLLKEFGSLGNKAHSRVPSVLTQDTGDVADVLVKAQAKGWVSEAPSAFFNMLAELAITVDTSTAARGFADALQLAMRKGFPLALDCALRARTEKSLVKPKKAKKAVVKTAARTARKKTKPDGLALLQPHFGCPCMRLQAFAMRQHGGDFAQYLRADFADFYQAAAFLKVVHAQRA